MYVFNLFICDEYVNTFASLGCVMAYLRHKYDKVNVVTETVDTYHISVWSDAKGHDEYDVYKTKIENRLDYRTDKQREEDAAWKEYNRSEIWLDVDNIYDMLWRDEVEQYHKDWDKADAVLNEKSTLSLQDELDANYFMLTKIYREAAKRFVKAVVDGRYAVAHKYLETFGYSKPFNEAVANLKLQI